MTMNISNVKSGQLYIQLYIDGVEVRIIYESAYTLDADHYYILAPKDPTDIREWHYWPVADYIQQKV
jgi:hypothetical protein